MNEAEPEAAGSRLLFQLQYLIHFPDKKVKNQPPSARLPFHSWFHLENSF